MFAHHRAAGRSGRRLSSPECDLNESCDDSVAIKFYFNEPVVLLLSASVNLRKPAFCVIDFTCPPCFSCFCALLAWHFLALDVLGFDLYLSQNKSHQLCSRNLPRLTVTRGGGALKIYIEAYIQTYLKETIFVFL